MDYRPVLARHSVPLTQEVDQWDKAALAVGLKPYECKASYVCGAMREFMQASGLNFENEYHLGALFLALDATELLGRVITGARIDEQDPQYVGPTKALVHGARYLRDHGDPQAARLPHRPQHYAELRNFAGHGATYLPPKLSFAPDSTRLLLRHLAYALNTMWDDTTLPAQLDAVEIHPVWTTMEEKLQPVYVRDIQEHLLANRPGDRLAHESWRYTVVSVDTSSPAVTGR
ncbi:hypothetical protein [Streptomyces bottropensis]|uniref:hypothetical protein n=1 Tax=Streptomyces bottropensis TaxID=42235 RepID=UPI003673F179